MYIFEALSVGSVLPLPSILSFPVVSLVFDCEDRHIWEWTVAYFQYRKHLSEVGTCHLMGFFPSQQRVNFSNQTWWKENLEPWSFISVF